MSRFSETEAALIKRLRALKSVPDKSINLHDVGAPLNAAGFAQDEIMAVLNALEQDKIIALAPGNRLLILKKLPD
jgi:flagellar basal body P-ring protein FlgI